MPSWATNSYLSRRDALEVGFDNGFTRAFLPDITAQRPGLKRELPELRFPRSSRIPGLEDRSFVPFRCALRDRFACMNRLRLLEPPRDAW